MHGRGNRQEAKLRSTPAVSYVYDTIYPRATSMTDGTGTTSYTYNPVPGSGTTTGAARLASMTGPLANSAVTYSYDELGRVLGTSINGSANASSVVYDALSRVTSATNPLGTFGYAYVNQTGRVSSVTYPNGQVTNYSYHPNSTVPPGNDDQRLAQIQNLASGGANLSTYGYAYNAAGLITSWSKQVGTGSVLTSVFLYDAADQLISATLPSDSAVASRAYAYDPAGNRTREQVNVTTSAFSFNTVNQLTAQSAGGDLAFTGTVNEPAALTVGGNAATVDASGIWVGRAAVNIGANSIPLVATDLNGSVTSKTISVTVSGGTARTLTYDLNGNLTDNGAGQTYAWDAANRLISITQGSNVTTFVYNGQGQRVQEKLNGTVIKQWVWNGGAQPAEERDGSNAVTKRFYGLGEQIGGVAYFFTADHLGSIREMIDSTGLIRARYDYDPYGRITKVSGDLEADYGFTGFYRHQASGLNLTLYRVYDPELGRWLARDPIGEIGGLNLYGYVANNVLNYVDPFGLVSFPMPPNWQNLPCNDLANLAQQLADVIAKRSKLLRTDPNNLFIVNPFGDNSWYGHITQYKSAQNQLQKVIDKMRDNGCGDKIPVDAIKWVQQPAPIKPDPTQPMPIQSSLPWWLILLVPIPGNPVYAGA